MENRWVESIMDTHCHIHTCPSPDPVGSGWAVMGVSPESDWDEIAGMLGRPGVVGGYGVHPWYAARAIGWEGTLGGLEGDREAIAEGVERVVGAAESRLGAAVEEGHFVLVGEIGVDKFRGFPPEMEECDLPGDYGEMSRNGRNRAVFTHIQVPLFEAQFESASRLGLPVSIHCVQAGGYVFEFLSRMGKGAKSGVTQLPPGIALHSVSLKPALVKSMVSLPSPVSSILFFGLSPVINFNSERNKSKTLQILPLIPQDSLLLESDLDDHSDRDFVVSSYVALVSAIADLWSSTPEEVVAIANANARRWLGAQYPCSL